MEHIERLRAQAKEVALEAMSALDNLVNTSELVIIHHTPGGLQQVTVIRQGRPLISARTFVQDAIRDVENQRKND